MTSPFVYASPDQMERDKAKFARDRVAQGRPVVALEYADGVVFVAENPRTLHKFAEIYDRIAFAAVGKYNEYEMLRIDGIQFAELTGFNYSREDVNARALANRYSQTLGRIFGELTKPFEVELIVAQVGERDHRSEMYRVTFQGIMTDEHGFVAIGGKAEELATYLKDHYREDMALDDGVRLGVEALRSVDPDRELTASVLEVAALDRALGRRKFRRLTHDRVAAALQE